MTTHEHTLKTMKRLFGEVYAAVSDKVLVLLQQETDVKWVGGQRPAYWTPGSANVVCFNLETCVLTHYPLKSTNLLPGEFLSDKGFLEIVKLFCPKKAGKCTI
jgi:hypothetical protein